MKQLNDPAIIANSAVMEKFREEHPERNWTTSLSIEQIRNILFSWKGKNQFNDMLKDLTPAQYEAIFKGYNKKTLEKEVQSLTDMLNIITSAISSIITNNHSKHPHHPIPRSNESHRR